MFIKYAYRISPIDLQKLHFILNIPSWTCDLTGAIHTIIFHDGKLLSGSDDMSVGVVNITEDDTKSLILSKLLQGHVSRVRALDCQSDKVLSGSDDRSVKLWSIETGNKIKAKKHAYPSTLCHTNFECKQIDPTLIQSKSTHLR